MPFSQGKKVFFITVISVIGVSALVLNVFRLKNTLVLPPAKPSAGAPSVLEPLNAKDTDGDGIPDTEETSTYGTSPYLKDTDSDGIPDNVEIQNKTNPLCPEGKTCPAQVFSPVSAPLGELNALLGALERPAPGVAESPQANPELLAKLLSGQATLPELRDFLKSQGAREDDLAKINDEALLSLYHDALKQIVPPSAPAGNSTPEAR